MPNPTRRLVTACLLSLPGVLLMPIPSAAREREATEWSTTYNFNANEAALPRVLLIGDSICNGYAGLVRDKLNGAAYVSFWASSKCATDPSYLKELTFLLGEYPYAVLHFNNGLHSLGTDPGEWEKALRAAFDLLRAQGKGAKIIWAASTPLKDPDLTAKARALNAVAAKVVAEYGFPTDDLFALMDPQDRDKLWTDTFHYNEQGRDMQAKQVADAVRPLLAGWAAPAGTAAGPVKNADFEGAGGWNLYPPKPENGLFELSTDGPHSGKRAAKVTVLQAGLQFYQYSPALVAGATYALKYWARAAQPSRLTVHVRTQKPPYVFYGDHTVNVTTEWQEFGTTLTLPADYKPGEHVLFFNLVTVGTYWLDDVTITP